MILCRVVVRKILILAPIVYVVGCAASIKNLPQYETVQDYQYFVNAGDLAIGLEFIERPDRRNPFLNRPFRERGILALSARLQNLGANPIAVSVQSMALLTDDGPLRAVTRSSAARAMSHSFRRTAQQALLFSEVRYGYLRYGFPDVVLLEPGEEDVGFIFFQLSDENIVVHPAKLRLQTSKFFSVRQVQFSADVIRNTN